MPSSNGNGDGLGRALDNPPTPAVEGRSVPPSEEERTAPVKTTYRRGLRRDAEDWAAKVRARRENNATSGAEDVRGYTGEKTRDKEGGMGINATEPMELAADADSVRAELPREQHNIEALEEVNEARGEANGAEVDKDATDATQQETLPIDAASQEPSPIFHPAVLDNTGLVEARTVKENNIFATANPSQDAAILSAERQKRHWRWVAFTTMGLCLILFIVVAAALLTSSGSATDTIVVTPGPMPEDNTTASPTPIPSMAPTSFLQDLPDYTVQAIEVTGTAQQKAYEWTFNHPEFEVMENWRKNQLLALATFYYSMNGEEWVDKKNWMDPHSDECYWFTDKDTNSYCNGYMCGSPPGYHWGDQLCFLSSASSINIVDTSKLTNCNDKNRFEYLKWANFARLEGTIPPELFLLTALTTLDLGDADIGRGDLGNNIIGTIPTEVGLLSLLETLDLSGNGIEGTIPSEIGMTKLSDRSGNSRGGLALQRNFISGALPTELGLLSTLVQINVEDNGISGALPSELGVLSKPRSTKELHIINYSCRTCHTAQVTILGSFQQFDLQYTSK